MNYEDMTDDITTKTQTTNQLTAEEILAQALAALQRPPPASTPTNDTVEATVTTDDDEPYTVSLDITARARPLPC